MVNFFLKLMAVLVATALLVGATILPPSLRGTPTPSAPRVVFEGPQWFTDNLRTTWAKFPSLDAKTRPGDNWFSVWYDWANREEVKVVYWEDAPRDFSFGYNTVGNTVFIGKGVPTDEKVGITFLVLTMGYVMTQRELGPCMAPWTDQLPTLFGAHTGRLLGLDPKIQQVLDDEYLLQVTAGRTLGGPPREVAEYPGGPTRPICTNWWKEK